MNIIDLTDSYIKHILRNNDLSAYERSYPALFGHYFKYWARRKFFSKTLTKTEVKRRLDLIKPRLKIIEKNICSLGFDTSHLDILLFVGQNTSNGHAFKDRKRFIAWIPIETYETLLRVDVFITHEIVHALHYTQSPDFYFHTFSEKRSTSRQLITEGLATYLTMDIMNVNDGIALWADYLSKRELKIWLQKCQQKERELNKFVLKNFSLSNPKTTLFEVDDPNNIYEDRAGYFLGLSIINQIVKVKKLNAKELLSMPRKKIEEMVLEQLELNAI